MIGEPFKVTKETTNIVYAADNAPLKIRYAKKPDKKRWHIAVFQDHDEVIVELSNVSLASSNDAPYVLAAEGGGWCGKTASNGSETDPHISGVVRFSELHFFLGSTSQTLIADRESWVPEMF